MIVYEEIINERENEGISEGREEEVGERKNDEKELEERIREWREKGGRGKKWIVVERIY